MSFPTVTIGELERWVLFGAQWRVAGRSRNHVLIDLCTCTGEPVERREAREPDVVGYVIKTEHLERGKTCDR
jgi:hypothetical protein